ncbi:MAG TPA: CpsB/CapC family capsule biosynthesis tyrosine phosphatase [Solirubrobacterales bacterium]|nr:CpsB/CapC family capsule biosynthesis tyrosine phosphatase [Solirubrobacterales bacterium]
MDLIDLHCHLLPGIDDGPADLDGAVALAEAYLAAGIGRVAATPHVNLRHRNRADGIEERRAELNARLTELGIDLRIEPGAEISATVAAEIGDGELRRLTLGGGEWLLVEPPSRASAFDIHQAVFEVQRRGFKVLLAHPERNTALRRDLDLLGDLVASGMRTQITAEALTGRFGSDAEACSRELFARNLVHTVASDAHHATERPPGLTNELKRSGHRDLVRWLCHDMPAWILDGGEEPLRPGAGASGETRNGGGLLRRLGLRR